MHLLKKTFLLIGLFVGFVACTKDKDNEVAASKAATQLEKKWVLKGVMIGDILDLPCAGSQPDRDITLEMIYDPATDSYQLSGQSAVNYINGSLKLKADYKKDTVVPIEVPMLGSTKKAGSQEKMECELRYFDILNNANELMYQDGKLMLGNFTFQDSLTNSSGVYLIFE